MDEIDRDIKAAVRKDWNLDEVIRELRAQKWRGTEPYRIDRMLWLGEAHAFMNLARKAVGPEAWKGVKQDGMEHEIVDDYLEALASAIRARMREHVYVTFHEGEVYAGQYEDMSAEELRAMGFEIEGRKR